LILFLIHSPQTQEGTLNLSDRKERVLDALQVILSLAITVAVFFLVLPHLEVEIAIRIPANFVGLVASLLLAIPTLCLALLLMKHTLLLYITKYRREMYAGEWKMLYVDLKWPIIFVPLVGLLVWYFTGILLGIAAALITLPLIPLLVYAVGAQAVENHLGWGCLDNIPDPKPVVAPQKTNS
jgi:hypothetical protein